MVETINDPNLAWRVWETNFNEVLNWHAPLRHQRVRQSSIPWLNSNIKNLMRKRDYHKKQSVKYNSEHHWRLYQSFRNNVNIQPRKSKSHYYRQKIGECKKNDPKTTWTLINTLIGRSSSSKHINEVKVDNVTLRDDENISKAFNEFFINIGPKLASEVSNLSTNKIETFLEDHVVTFPSFHFSTIPVENVLNTLRHLNVSKGTGLDKIPAKTLRVAADKNTPSLTYIFNLSISTGVFVDNWKDARVIPIYKGGDRRILGNYRPISILPIVSKVFEKEIFKQLYKHLNDNKLISKFQSGFRPGHSTITALIQMCDNWYENMDNGKLTGVVFIDIRKAFDSIDHAILPQKLAYYGVSQLEHTWFQSYLANRQQQCHVNGSLSTKKEIICGVPQGSILGPLLFLIYINDLPNCLKKTAPCLYADDTQIFASFHDPVELANDINSDFLNVTNWLNVNKLQSHSSKTKLMIIGSKQNLNNIAGDLNSSITMNNNLLSSVVSNKCLGVDIDKTLSFRIHIEDICKKICSGVGILRRIKPFVPQGSLVTLYKSLIQPYFDYCAPLWDTCDKALKDKLQILQNRAARVITGVTYHDRIRSNDLLQLLGWGTLHVRRAKLKCILLYKVLNEDYSPCLGESFVRLTNLNRGYNLRNDETDLALPKPKTNFLKRSFKYSASMLWINLSLEAMTATSLRQFKQNISNCCF